jgi:hypothetical protein
MRSTRILILGAVVALACVTTLCVMIGHKPVEPSPAELMDTHSFESSHPRNAVVLEPTLRVPAGQELPMQTTSTAPVLPALVPPPPESLGNASTWPGEYANKPIADLIADEARLNREFEKDIDAEFEKRFKDGRYVSYPQGSQPMEGKTWGILRAQGDENTVKYVDLDPRIEPELFIKQEKALWLRGEIARRQR